MIEIKCGGATYPMDSFGGQTKEQYRDMCLQFAQYLAMKHETDVALTEISGSWRRRVVYDDGDTTVRGVDP